MTAPEPVVHRVPLGDEALTPCCGRTLADLPRTDRVTGGDGVTCSSPEPVVLTDGEVELLGAGCFGDGEYLCCDRTTHRKTGKPVGGQMLDAVERILADRLAAERAAHEALREAVLAIHRLGPDGVCFGCWEAGGYDGAPNYPCETALAATAPTPPQERCTCGAGDHRPPGAHNIHCADPDASAPTPSQDAATEGGL